MTNSQPGSGRSYTVRVCPACGKQAIEGYDGPHCPDGHADDVTDGKPGLTLIEVVPRSRYKALEEALIEAKADIDAHLRHGNGDSYHLRSANKCISTALEGIDRA